MALFAKIFNIYYNILKISQHLQQCCNIISFPRVFDNFLYKSNAFFMPHYLKFKTVLILLVASFDIFKIINLFCKFLDTNNQPNMFTVIIISIIYIILDPSLPVITHGSQLPFSYHNINSNLFLISRVFHSPFILIELL